MYQRLLSLRVRDARVRVIVEGTKQALTAIYAWDAEYRLAKELRDNRWSRGGTAGTLTPREEAAQAIRYALGPRWSGAVVTLAFLSAKDFSRRAEALALTSPTRVPGPHTPPRRPRPRAIG